MHQYPQNRISRWTWAALFCLAIASCSKYRGPDPVTVHSLTVQDVTRDTIFALPNESASDQVDVTFESTVTNLAVAKFSSDTSFTPVSGLLVSAGYNSPVIVGGIKGDTLYVQYLPLKFPTEGKLTIGVTFRK